MMALQLQSFADLRPDALQHVIPQLFRDRRTKTWTRRRRAQPEDGFSVSPTGAIRVSLSERGNRMPSSSVAVPGYSSLLRRGRLQEIKLDAGDRITQIAEWVSRKVKDPLVEIDPVTVGRRIKWEQQEEQIAREKQMVQQDEIESSTGESPPPSEGTIATVAASTFDQPPPGFPRGMDNSTKAAAGAALILATAGVAYLAFRSNGMQSNSKQKGGSLSASPAPAGIGGTSRVINHTKESPSSPSQDLHGQFAYPDGDTSDKAVSVRDSVVLTSIQSISQTHSYALSPSVTPHKEGVEKASFHEDLSSSEDVDLPVARPFEDVVAVNDRKSEEEVGDSEVEAVEFQNALVFDQPQAAEELLRMPEEDSRKSLSEECASAAIATSEYVDDLATVSDVELPGVEFQSAMVSDTTPVETFEVKPLDHNVAMETSTPQLVEDPVLFNLDPEPPAPHVVEEVQMAGILNGAAAIESDANPDEERRKAYAEALQAVVPALAVGAGAVSTLTGLDSGLEMVGLVATASFVAREMFLYRSRAQLFGEVRKVKDHKSFIDFLKSREIIRDIPEE